MAERRSWMPIYWGDYLGDTLGLTIEEHGAYLILIAVYWTRGKPLPNDDREICRILRIHGNKWRAIKPKVLRFFEVSPDFLTHKRVEKELSQCRKISRLRSAIAKQLHGTPQPQPEKKKESDTSSESKQTPKEYDMAPPDGGQINGSYAFEGQVIKLLGRDYKRWLAAYPDIDLKAELTALDDYYASELKPADRKKWFVRCSQALANRQEHAKASGRACAQTDFGKFGL